MPGTYVVARIPALRRDFGGEALNRATTATVQIGQSAPTTFTAQTGKCENCHTGPSAFAKILHGGTDRRSCFACHASLEFEPDAALDIRVHMVHDRSNRFPADINTCATCHLVPPGGPARACWASRSRVTASTAAPGTTPRIREDRPCSIVERSVSSSLAVAWTPPRAAQLDPCPAHAGHTCSPLTRPPPTRAPARSTSTTTVQQSRNPGTLHCTRVQRDPEICPAPADGVAAAHPRVHYRLAERSRRSLQLFVRRTTPQNRHPWGDLHGLNITPLQQILFAAPRISPSGTDSSCSHRWGSTCPVCG